MNRTTCWLSGVVAVLLLLVTCTTPEKLPVGDGAAMQISRADRALERGDPGYESQLQVLWFGTMCHVIQLGDLVVLTDPFVTSGAPLLKMRSDPRRVGETFGRMKNPPDAIFVHHGHSDHLLDAHAAMALPRWRGAEVKLYAGKTSKNILAGWQNPAVMEDVHAIDPAGARQWNRVPLSAAKASLGYSLRFMPLPSRHGAHLKCGKVLFSDNVTAPRTTPPSRIGHYQSGEVFNFLLELKSPSATRYALHGFPVGDLPGSFPPSKYPLDLAFVSVPPADAGPEYPIGILRKMASSHLVLTHFNNFFDEDLDQALSAGGFGIRPLIRKVQGSFAADPGAYPRFEAFLVPTPAMISADGVVRNVISIP